MGICLSIYQGGFNFILQKEIVQLKSYFTRPAGSVICKMNDLHYLKASVSRAAPSSGESRSKLTQFSILLVTGVLNSILEKPVFLSSLSNE